MAKRRKTDNTMAKRRRTDNTMAKRRRTDNTMAKRNDLQNTTQKIKVWATQTPLKTVKNSEAAASVIDLGSERKSA